ncbi:MAG: PAC2 family protein [Actinomycetaceae bacterium]|nr:PAC2 family protein [Actinomycetaceae bacterium]
MVTGRNSLIAWGPAKDAQADVLIHHLHGAMDAGRAGRGLVENLLDSLPSQRILTLDSDALMDYRAHRPWLTFENWTFTEVAMPVLALDLVQDDNSKNFMVLHGPEPDLRWEELLDTLATILENCGVKKTISVMGMGAAVPHSRPTPVHMHAMTPQNLPKQPQMEGSMKVPSGFDQVLEYTLGGRGIDAMGLVAAVPYYLTDGLYPPAAVSLANRITSLTGLALPVGDLEAASSLALGQVEKMVTASGEAARMIEMLEENFDEASTMTSVPTAEESLPTADEIGAKLEAYLERTNKLGQHGSLDVTPLSVPEKSEKSDFGSLSYGNQGNVPPPFLQKKGRGRHRADPEEKPES